MNYKRIVFMLVIFIFLFSASSAYAGDVADAAVASEDTGIELTTTQNDVKTIENEQMINVTDSSEVLSASDDGETVVAKEDSDVLRDSQGTYADLASEIALGGDYIELKHDSYTYRGALITISINHPCVIDGKGAVIDMAGSEIQTFRIKADGVVFKNLIIKNAKYDSYSAQIYFEKSGALINCNFTNNAADRSYGVVYFNGKGELTNCNFVSNRALYGGAVYFKGNGELTNCNFVSNRGLFGGAVYFNGNGELTNCNFADNFADNFGGAFLLFDGKGEVTNCNFTDNSATLVGGAVQMSSGSVKNCNFINNKLRTEVDTFGGAISFVNGGTVINSNFTNNIASLKGGAIHFSSKGNVTNCSFRGNKVNASESSGGAVYFSKDSAVVGCDFTSNVASSHGGAVYFENVGDVANCNFADNKATASGNSGGAVYFSKDSSVVNSNFTNNVVSSHGGAVHFNGAGDVANCSFVGNKVTASGSSGGAVYFSKDSAVVGCDFTSNVASSQGGAAYFADDGEVANCSFADNKVTASGSSGGAVHINNYGIVTNCTFNNNNAKNGNASAIWIYFGFTENCNFTNNVASYGTVYFSWKGYVINCSFIKNTASVSGGAIWLPAGNVENSNFIGNKATEGGAILCDGAGNVTNCSFVDNKVTESGSSGIIGSYGGAIFWQGSNGVVSDCSFVSNSATYGGAIFWQSSKGTVSDCSFADNTAVDGGAIWWRGSNGVVSDCSFVSNSATNYGGAIFWQSSNGVVSGCVFVNNRAKYGVIHFRNSQESSVDMGRNLTINDNIFLNNNAAAIYFSKDDSTSNADYNWFGHNATNYNVKPAFTHVKINNWLFLNGTADPDNITFSGTSDVVFKLYAFNSNVVSDYDNDLLSKVNLTITSKNGEVNVTEAKFGESVLFSADDEGIGEVTARIENVACTVPLTIIRGTSFRDLNKTINGNNDDVIVLDRDYTYDPTMDYNFKDGIIINRPMTIIGNNHTLNALNQARIFNIRADNVAIENITFENAKSTGDGGAVYWDGANGNLYDCNFVNNSVEGKFSTGGAVYWDGANGNLYDCNFVNNSAEGAFDEGGAVYWNGDYGNLYGCDFVNSSVDSDGGAIYWHGDYGNLYGCDFVNSFAGNEGGAIYWFGDDSNLYGCEFVNNSAADKGGALCCQGDHYNLYVCEFVDNSAETGGAVYWKSSDNGAVSDCIFNNNSAEEGGAILWFDSEDCVVSDCTFENNRAEGDAGAVYWDDSDRGLLLDSTFVNNSAERGGAVLWNGKKGNLSDCVFVDNSAERGGAVYWDCPEGSISGCVFESNSADQGIIHSRNGVYDDLAINHNIFLNNDDVAIYFYKITSNSSTDYNWFGNNATNYDEEPVIVNGKLDNWLFLNATADPASLAIDESTDIAFKLYSYGSTGVSDYDNSQVYPIYLTVTATNIGYGILAELGEIITYEPVVFEQSSVTAEFENARYTIVIGIRIDPNLSFEPQEVIYSNSTSIAVSYNSTATGKVNITLIGKKSNYLFVDLDLNETIQLGDIGADEYEVTVKYSGDYNFISSTATGTLTVNKADSSVILNNVEFDEGEHIVIIAIAEGAEGVTAKIDGNKADVINNVILVPEGLDDGNHTLEVTTIPDKNHNPVNRTVTIYTGSKHIRENTPISLDVSSIENNATFTVTVDSDATGIVRFELSGPEEYTVYVDVSKGKAVLEIVLVAGDYEVVATYMGDDRFNSNITSERFTVTGHVKKDTPISADVKVNGNLVTITVNVDSDATGFVGLKQAGSTIYVALDKGVATYSDTFDAGSYNVDVSYMGDDDFNVNSTVLQFTVVEVAKENTTIALDVETFENNATFTVNLNSDATGIVRFEVTGAEEYTVYADVLNGKAVMEDVLSVGDYTVVATYMGDSRFNSNVTSESFTIKGHVKKDTPISANVNVNGYRVTVTVEVNESATGFVNMKFADTEFNVAVNNGVGSLTVDLPANSYNVDVTYLGDDNFNENMTKVIFTVLDPVKENTTIGLDVSSVENNATFTVNLNPDATGIVKFEVSGAEDYTVYADVLNGKAVMEDVLSVGDYEVVATYIGDARFNSNITSARFTITGHVKKDTPISADAKVNGNLVTITVNVDESATGFVGLKLAGSTIYVAVENGVATYVNKFEEGSYNVEVTYLGDDDFNENSTRLLFTVVRVAKENTTIGLDVSSVEDYATFTVNVDSDATGIVKFEVTGAEEYTVYADVLNGKAVMEDVLSVGDYTVVATYMGDSRFNSNVTSKNFNIKGHVKIDTPISADVNVNGYKVTVNVLVNETATGFVNMKFADTEFNVAVNNGVGSLTVDLPANSYNVDVTYLGDDNFNENKTKITFTVIDPAKENTTIGLDVSSVEDNATFTVSLNPDATGIVKFEVTGAEEYTVYADVLNGKAVMEDVLSVGDYSVVATYMGDSRFNSNVTSGSFTIRGHVKKDTPISADAKVVGNRVTITVNVDESAGGFIGLKLSGSTIYTVVENGVAKYVSTFDAGSYNVEVLYTGDDNFNENSTRVLFTVVGTVKEDTPISLNVSSVEDYATFTVNVNPYATGVVRFVVSGAEEYTVYADVLNGKAVMEDVLEVGDYTVVATYMGDDKFNSNVTSQDFTITGHVKKDTPISADAKVVGNRVTITVNVDENATGFVGLKLTDSTIYVVLDKGVATYVNTFAVGSYNIDVTYTGDDDYNENSTKVLFTVIDTDKQNTTIDLNVSSVEDYVTFTVNVNPDATGIVKFEVSGAEKYVVYADVLNGKAVMEDVLASGNYTVVATYMGDVNFNSNTTLASFAVEKEPVIIPVASEFSDITINDDLSIYIVLKDEAGNVIANAPIVYVVNGTAGTTTTSADGSFTIKAVNGAKVDINYAGNESVLPTNLTLTFNVPDVPVVVKTATHFDIPDRTITINGYAVDGPADEQGIYYATTLLDADGKPVSNVYMEFAVNNKIYNRTTYENGSFKPYKLNMIRAGRYTMAFNFAGDDNYTNAFACVCVDLDKKPITIKASAKSYKVATKTKKYTVTLSTIKGVDGKMYLSPKKVSLKVNGKTFTGKTNAKGQVTFKITNLNKKAKYKATISYAGDKTYEAATKSVTLTVK